MKSKSILSKRVICVVGVIVGIAIIIGGFVISKYFNGMLSSGPTTSTTFGADYYTKQYGATTDILWDIYNVFMVTRLGISLMLFSFGAFDICYFLSKLCDTFNAKSTENKEQITSTEKFEVQNQCSENTNLTFEQSVN